MLSISVVCLASVQLSRQQTEFLSGRLSSSHLPPLTPSAVPLHNGFSLCDRRSCRDVWEDALVVTPTAPGAYSLHRPAKLEFRTVPCWLLSVTNCFIIR
jgi:hypothetical protein